MQNSQTSEAKELEALELEIKQASASLESDVAAFIAKAITPELEELFFEDKEAFLKEIFKMQNQYLEEHIKPKIERAQKLENDLTQKAMLENFDKGLQVFTQKHPEVNIEDLIFLYQGLSKEEQEQLGTLRPLEFFEALLELFNQAGEKQNQTEGAPPRQIQGVGAGVQSTDAGQDLPMERI